MFLQNRFLKLFLLSLLSVLSLYSFATDTDNDGLPDDWEIENGRDPLVADYQISMGSEHSCALVDTGVECWGTFVNYGAAFVPELTNPKMISSGTGHACALDDTGVVCWGYNNMGQTDVPPLQNPWQVDAGQYHSCAIDDTGVICWGWNDYGQSTVPELSNPIEVRGGQSFTCAIDDTGVVCWGDDSAGKTSVPALEDPSKLALGHEHACMWDKNEVVCWGYRADQQPGSWQRPTLSDPKQIDAGADRTCAISRKTSGTWAPTDTNFVENDLGVVCWGNGYYVRESIRKAWPWECVLTTDGLEGCYSGASLKNPTQISVGQNAACALSDSGVECFGSYSGGGGKNNIPTLMIDPDGDGYSNQGGGDAFPLDATEWFDTDLDGEGDNQDSDDDGDGIEDAMDAFPLDGSESVDTDGDGIGNNADQDDDGDGIEDNADEFPLDTDNDGINNDLDEDDDNDGVPDELDQLPLDPTGSIDTDSDGVSDNADALPFDASETLDQDYDGVGDNSDNCINVGNTFQEDLDGDGLGDACDSVFNPDPDGDGSTYNDLFPFDASEALDSDGDGIGDNSDENYLYPENGKNGSSVNFQAYDVVPVNLGARAIYTSTGKLNTDSKDDLLIVCGNGCGQIISFTSNADETWNLNLVSETLDVPTSAFIADIDGDSDSDILATNYRDNGGVYYFESVAGAIDPDPVIINSDFYGAISVKAYDFDKDGDQDLVYASSWHNEVVFEKQLSSSTTKITLSTEVWGVNNLILIDYNRDSWMDIMAVAENSGELIYFENSKNGQFKSKETIFEEEGYLRDATITDYDADGDLDIFAATSGSFDRAGLMLYERVSGSLERQVIDNTSMLFKYPIEAFPKNIIASDFDNDGDLDLFVEFSNSNAAFYEKSSSGVFSDPKLVLGFTYNQSVIGSYELSDYDNDGDDDLWWVSSPFGISIFENTCSDIDSDGICDVRDNDQDGDSLSNEEELLLGLDPRNKDSDRDGVDDALDDFPLNLLETTDTDGDGIGDNTDLFPNNINEFQDFDLDGIGNNTDDDDDNDGIADVDDAFPFNPGEWSDTDLDGIGDRRDLDDDGDGVNDIDDLFPLDLTEAYDSDGDGVGDNGDAFPNDSSESLDTDGDGIGNNSDTDDDNDGFSDEQELIDGTDPLSKFSCREGCASLDLDGNENYDALTDGLLLLRGMFGLDGGALLTGTIASDAIYTSSVDITTRINDLGSAADIDGNGTIDALTDGLLTLRYLFGLEGDTLINGVVAGDASRKTAEEIEAHLETLMPAL